MYYNLILKIEYRAIIKISRMKNNTLKKFMEIKFNKINHKI